ncbi:UNVERIFIED_CONTAM: pyruvate dehydrogenase complex, mitochondrial [Sesamum radiatum]|uniref:Pyruvate dehydrogenase complex, mitochondrial n=1 Tax=Sesamum radiatum TaxID=300843 RepID=A0AAW2PFM1_SESRA
MYVFRFAYPIQCVYGDTDISRPSPIGIGHGDRNGFSNSSSRDISHGKEQGKCPVDSKEGSCTSNRLAVQQSTTKLSQKFFYRFRSSTTPRDWDAFSVTYNDGGTCLYQGNIARWLKKEGDKVSPGEVLCEVETVGDIDPVFAFLLIKSNTCLIIAITVEEEEDVAKFKDYTPSASDAAPASKPPSAPTQTKQEVAEVPVTSPEPKVSKPSAPSSAGNRIFASPLARKLAEDHNISLSNIKGTGPDGRIVKADIEDYLASRGKEVSQAPKADTTVSAALDYTDIPHSQIRKVTALRLLQSKQTIPHYYLTVDTCVDKLMELRSQLNSLQEASGGKRISVNDLVIKAAALALRKVPQCNSSWTNDYIRQYHNVNINVAVQTDNGLYVPVIKDADKKGLSKISDEVKHLAQKAKENSLKPEDYEGGTFTVSNLGGPFGIKQFCAIINPPQSGILAVGSAEKRVIPGGGPDQYKFASFMSVTLSCDHRVIDGAIGAEWLKAFKGYIENPESMLL